MPALYPAVRPPRPPTPVPQPQPAQLLRDRLKRQADRYMPPPPRPKPAPPPPPVTLPYQSVPAHIPTGVLGLARWLLTPPPRPDDEEACRGA